MVSPTRPRPPRTPVAMAAAAPHLLRRVDRHLAEWRRAADAIPDPELRRQAKASLTRKRFHCEGGAVYALAAPPGPPADSALRFIVALQTISDYLDNLSDRSVAGGADDLELLHTAMREAVDPGTPDGPRPVPRDRVPEAEGRTAPPGASGEANRPAEAAPAARAHAPLAADRFYRLHPHRDDGGYLAALVAACRAEVARLPAASAGPFAQEARRLVDWYCDLQVRKHLPSERERAVREWAEGLRPYAPGLAWWEIAAATGSTLGVFALYAAALGDRLDAGAAAGLRAAYFPWVTGLHILLDYWIDRAEDTAGGDLNFTFFYASAAAGAARLARFAAGASRAVRGLPDAGFHRTVVAGLPALYLADPKVARQGLRLPALGVLRGAGPSTWLLYWTVRWLRRAGVGTRSSVLSAPSGRGV